MTRSRSLVLLISVTFLVLYSVWSLSLYVSSSAEIYNAYVARKSVQTINHLKLGRAMLGQGLEKDLGDLLKEAKANKYIDYYIVKKGPRNLYEDLGHHVGDGPEREVTEFDKLIYFKDGFAEAATRIGEYQIILGFNRSRLQFEKFRWEEDMVLQDLLVVALMGLGIVAYFLRDLVKIVRSLREKGKAAPAEIRPLSKETEVLARGLAAYDHRVISLDRENKVLKNQVLPALRSELSSGKRPPYEFGCTLVRTDINNFSGIFNGHDRERFMAYINEFFSEASHIVSRYRGFVYEFVGDEVIYYFKDEDHDNSAAIALSAVRDINRLAGEMSERTSSESGYQFRVKSSLATGALRYGPLVNGYSLAGSILIETVRVLSHIPVRGENAVYFGSAVNEQVQFLCGTREESVVLLKGLAGSRSLYSYLSHIPIEGHLRRLTRATVDNLAYYKSDDDLAAILDFLRSSLKTIDKELFIATLGVLRDAQCTKTGRVVRRAYQALLAAVADHHLDADQVRGDYLLAATISLAQTLLERDSFDDGLTRIFRVHLHSKDRRVLANTLDIFAHFHLPIEKAIIEDVLSSNDNRVLANALVREGRLQIDQGVVQRLEEMLRSDNPYFTASGLYAVGEIGKFHHEANPVYLSANTDFQRLLEAVPEFLEHSNRMVRRQALEIVRKLQDPGLEAAVDGLYRSTKSPSVRQELAAYLFDTPTDQVTAITGKTLAS